ncbi:MAG TPA: MASE3 domain-containing protein [Anaeromyxobacteraceae bacterium]|nr:MASE3 domain-containing protein [Anaeromyxobacteraceae bacterium]
MPYALPLAIAGAFLRPAMQQAWPERAYLALHLVVELLAAVAAFGTFAVQWYAAGARLNDARARFIGAAFLVVGILGVAHLLSFPGMPGMPWLRSSTERGIVYWLAARCLAVGALLGALFVPPTSASRALRRGPLLAGAVGCVAVLLAVDYLFISERPIFYVEGAGLTPLKRALELVVAAGAALGVIAYGRASRRRADPSANDLALALGLTVLSELCFALYARAYDSFNLLGHAYLLLATGWLFRALFAEAVLRPHERLDAASRDLAASNAELQRLRAHVEGELDVTIRDLRALQEQREDLLRAVSHDVRTPLQIVMLQADRLARMVPPGSRERGAADAVARAGRQMNGLISDLVDSVYLESGAMHLRKEPLALGPFLTELLAAGAFDADRFRVEVPSDLPPVPADVARLTRVVQNLAGNALKYSAPGSAIAVEARRVEDEVVVSFADRGAGISPEDVPRIFERFYRGGQRGKVEGLGLGLHISRLIVAAHGGRIWCESTVGEGSTFRFALPIGDAPLVQR